MDFLDFRKILFDIWFGRKRIFVRSFWPVHGPIFTCWYGSISDWWNDDIWILDFWLSIDGVRWNIFRLKFCLKIDQSQTSSALNQSKNDQFLPIAVKKWSILNYKSIFLKSTKNFEIDLHWANGKSWISNPWFSLDETEREFHNFLLGHKLSDTKALNIFLT